MSRDMGPVSRCLGKDVPPARSWQDPLSDSSSGGRRRSNQPSPALLARELGASLEDGGSSALNGAAEPDLVDGKPTFVAQFIQLAYRCAATFRRTDYFGGCNGARIRLPPQSEWPVNSGLDKVEQQFRPRTSQSLPALLLDPPPPPPKKSRRRQRSHNSLFPCV